MLKINKYFSSLFFICTFQFSNAFGKQKKTITKDNKSQDKIIEKVVSQPIILNTDKDLSSKDQELLKNIEIENATKRALFEKQLIADLYKEKLELEKLRIQKEILDLKKELILSEIKLKTDIELSELQRKKDILTASIELEQAKMKKDLESFNWECLKTQKSIQKLKLDHENIEGILKTKTLQKELNKFAEISNENFLENPLRKDGTLVISDRKIRMNGIITPWKAKYVVDSISFYNKKNNKLPIFLILDNSPGGSVLAGQEILQALSDSKAPIYVVVNGYAASMAAIITTLAKKSFILRNAYMLHHQVHSSSNFINVRKAKEFLDLIKETHKRFLGPVAKKMGISLEKLDSLLYEKDSDGNWMVFGDEAVKLKWADNVIEKVEEIGIIEKPMMEQYTFKKFLEEYYQFGFSDSQNYNSETENSTVYLISDKDFYYMYDPGHKYKAVII